MESQWDLCDDRAKNNVYPRAFMDLIGVSRKDNAKIGVKMFNSKKLEDLDEQLRKGTSAASFADYDYQSGYYSSTVQRGDDIREGDNNGSV